MTVRRFRSTDAGAPQITATAGSCIAVLNACLVNGYGAQTPLGWSIAYTGTNLAVYRPGAGNQRYLYVDDTGTGSTVSKMYETMSAINTGTNPAPASGTGYIAALKTTSPYWEIVGNEKAFYFFINSSLSIPSYKNSIDALVSFFGDINSYLPGDTYNTMWIGGNSPPSTNFYFAQHIGSYLTSSTNTFHFILRNYLGTGSAIEVSKQAASAFLPKTTTYLGTNSADAVSLAIPSTAGTALYAPVRIIESTGSNLHFRGEMPGLWAPVAPLGNTGDIITGTGAHAGKTFVVWDVSNGQVLVEISNTW